MCRAAGTLKSAGMYWGRLHVGCHCQLVKGRARASISAEVAKLHRGLELSLARRSL